jgi:hypothetical protein
MVNNRFFVSEEISRLNAANALNFNKKMTMQAKRAQKIGWKKATGAFLFAFLLFEGFALFVVTNGDFANGFLYFLQAQIDSFFLSLVLVMLITIFLFSRMAGKQILVEKRNHVYVGLKFAGFTLAIVLAYALAFVFIQGIIMDHWPPFIAFLALFILSIWAWAAWRISRAGDPRSR